jgi:hypothetical protein
MSSFLRELISRRFIYWPALALILALLVSCGAAGQAPDATRDTTGALSPGSSPSPPGPTSAAPSPTTSSSASPPEVVVEVDLSKVPDLDTSQAGVPLRDIVFDTFGRYPSRYVPLDQADDELVLELRDAIAPVYQPVYRGPDGLPWLNDSDLVIGYVAGNDAYAYPIKVLDRHELVNDTLGDVPVLISYCPLCASGVVYSRQLGDRTLLFGNTSALYQSDLVMYDHQTGSYWFQTAGEAIVGPLSGERLDLLPSTTVLWGEWKKLYPETRVLTGTAASPSRFASSSYARGVFGGYQDSVNQDRFAFPVDRDKLDRRLPSGAIVLTAEVDGAVTAYPLELLGNAAANDLVGGQPVVVFSRADNRAAAAFSPVVDGRTLTFDFREDTSAFIDRETGSQWDAAGRAIQGPLQGTQLQPLKIQPLKSRRAFWFSIAISFPDIRLYQP